MAGRRPVDAEVDSVALRPGSSAFMFVLVALGAVLLLGDAALRGAWPLFAASVGPALLVVWAAWMLLVRPSIHIRHDRVIIVNVGRITEVPWVRVVDIRRKLQLVIELEDNHRVECWGSPFVRRPVITRRGQSPVTDDAALAALRGAWLSGADAMSVAPVVRRPDTIALTIGALALVACVLSLVATR